MVLPQLERRWCHHAIVLCTSLAGLCALAHAQLPATTPPTAPAASNPQPADVPPFPDLWPSQPPVVTPPMTGANAMNSFPLDTNVAVERYIHFFITSDREDFLQKLKLGGRYRPMVQRIFEQEGVPPELFYIADVESGFDIHCLSRSGALGMWQFMSEQAHDYGLVRTAWVDEREDPEKSTVAAAGYLKYLYGEFGDWYLAVAGYVAGPITVQRAVSTTGSADFWELARVDALSRNTRDYIPVLVAIATLAEHPDQYGLNLVEDPPEQYDTVHITAPVSLQLAADCAGAGLEEMRQLNPSLLHERVPADFDLHLPPGTAARFEPALALVPASGRLTWRLHRLAKGESLATVARRYDVGVSRLEAANELSADSDPDTGALLLIPTAVPAARAGNPEPPLSADASGVIRYKVKKGDTWYGLAHRFGVTQAQLHAWNPGSTSVLRIGRVLTIRPNAARSRPVVGN